MIGFGSPVVPEEYTTHSGCPNGTSSNSGSRASRSAPRSPQARGGRPGGSEGSGGKASPQDRGDPGGSPPGPAGSSPRARRFTDTSADRPGRAATTSLTMAARENTWPPPSYPSQGRSTAGSL